MSISIIKDNTVTYPTDVYYNFNIYLIKGYEKFLDNTPIDKINVRKKVCQVIDELKEILFDNTVEGNPNLPLPKTQILNVMDWEENLIPYFDMLDVSVKHRNEPPIKTIEMFLRKAKLERLNNNLNESTV